MGVRSGGDGELLSLTRRYDSQNISKVEDLVVTKEEIKRAYSRLDSRTLNALKTAARQIRAFSEMQLSRFQEKSFRSPLGFSIKESYRPLRRIGGYVPGGLAAYPSTVLMLGIPARVAGVKEIVISSPPQKDGTLPDSVLVAADLAGVSEVLKLGGAQAVAALALGTPLVRKVELIVGPGNEYVTEAKLQLASGVMIDFAAGPTELLVLADESANPVFVAEDIISQAEHGNRTICGVATTSDKIARSVIELIKTGSEARPRSEHISRCNLFSVVVKDKDLLIEFAKKFAPEHLEVMVKNPKQFADILANAAGLVLLGSYTPCSSSDYIVGTNHVLPTGGKASFYPGLGVERFLRRSTTVMGSKAAMKTSARYISTLAKIEGLPNHASAALARINTGVKRRS